MIKSLFLLLLWCSTAGAGTIPGSALGVEFDVPLNDQYSTGEPLPLKGAILDEQKSDGQILFNFVPRTGGEPLQLFLSLSGSRFAGYQVFDHEQAGTYDLEVYVGGPGDTRLGFAGVFEGLEIDPGAGVIQLPADYFPGVALDATFPTSFTTGEELVLAGSIDDPLKADGQLLWVFAPLDGGAEKRIYLPLRGDRFSTVQVFRHEESGRYQLTVYLGGVGETSLAYVGGYAVEVVRGSGPVQIPSAYFAEILLDTPLPTQLPVGRSLVLSGEVGDEVRGLRIELEAEEARVLRVGLEGKRFTLPLRLGAGERGPFLFRIVVEHFDGQFVLAGEFQVEGVHLPAPKLTLSALALGLRPGEDGHLTLGNAGTAALEQLRFEVEGPFSLGEQPARLAPGDIAQMVVRTAGTTGGEGLLRVHSDDPEQPVAVVALKGLAAAAPAFALPTLAVDEQGGFSVPGSGDERLLVLYATDSGTADSGAVYPFVLGGNLAKAAVQPNSAHREARDAAEEFLRQRDRALAKALQGRPLAAAKPALAEPQVGELRRFVFPDFGAVRQQVVRARLVAVADRALAWVHEGTPGPDAALVGQLIGQFSAEDHELISTRFGLPSDVDGDGRVSFLFSPLVDQVGGLAGFFSAVSTLPEGLGGTGDQADLMFISPTQEAQGYRSLLVHEFQHLVNFNQHVLVRGGEGESNWLNEGLSHLAEDLVAGYAASGQDQIVSAFLAEPSAVGLSGEALLDRRKRGAAYLFVRSLADRLGEGVVLRLVNTGLADRDNVEGATGEGFGALLGGWAAQLYLSGLGLFSHSRYDYQSPLLRAGEVRGFPLPAVQQYQLGGPSLQGALRPRGIALIHLSGGAGVAGRVDPDAQAGGLQIPLPSRFEPQLSVPADHVPGLHFTRLLPGRYLTGQDYVIEGQIMAPEHTQVLVRFSGEDTLRFFPEVEGGGFSQVLAFGSTQTGTYTLELFLGAEGELLDFAGSFGPVEVVAPPAQTAVAEAEVLPQGLVLGAAFPNPFNSAVSLPLTVPGPGAELLVEVYNLLGQRVRQLYGGRLEPGQQVLRWDGLDAQGAPAATGVYLFRAEGGGQVQVRRGLLLR